MCYAHSPSHAGHVTNPEIWNDFLGFGHGFKTYKEVKADKSLRHVALDWFKVRLCRVLNRLVMGGAVWYGTFGSVPFELWARSTQTPKPPSPPQTFT